MKRCIVGLVCAAVLCGLATPASADPISITSGSISWDYSSLHVDIRLDALGLELVSNSGAFGMPAAASEFLGGQLVDFSARLVSFVELMGPSWSGQTAPLQLSLRTDPVRTPSFAVPNFQTPFTASGDLDGAAVTGAGTLRLGIERVSALNVFAVTSANYTFAPTPEPATLLLFATGMIGVGVWRFRHAHP